MECGNQVLFELAAECAFNREQALGSHIQRARYHYSFVVHIVADVEHAILLGTADCKRVLLIHKENGLRVILLPMDDLPGLTIQNDGNAFRDFRGLLFLLFSRRPSEFCEVR